MCSCQKQRDEALTSVTKRPSADFSLFNSCRESIAAASSSSIAMSGLSVNPLQIWPPAAGYVASVDLPLFFAATSGITIYLGHMCLEIRRRRPPGRVPRAQLDLHLEEHARRRRRPT